MAGFGLGECGRQLTLDGSRPRSASEAAAVEAARFWAKVVVDPRPGGCQHWVGAIGDDGYGRFQAGTGPTARTVRAHRWMFEFGCGLRPLRWSLLHTCDETGCVALEDDLRGTDGTAGVPVGCGLPATSAREPMGREWVSVPPLVLRWHVGFAALQSSRRAQARRKAMRGHSWS